MTNYLSYIWEYIIDFAEYILFFYLMSSKAEYKLNINKKLFITLSTAGLSAFLFVLNSFNPSVIYTLLITFIVQFIICHFIYDTDFIKLFFWNIVYTLLTLFTDTLSINIPYIFFNITPKQLMFGGNLRYSITLTYIILFSFFIILICHINNSDIFLNIYEKIIFVSLSAIYIFMGEFVLTESIKLRPGNNALSNRLSNFCFIFLVTYIVLLIFIYQLGKSRNYNIKLKEEQQLYAIEKNNFQNIVEQTKELRFMKHDLSSHLTVITQMVREKKYDKLLEYLNEYNAKIEVSHQLISTGNIIIDSIVTFYIHKAHINNIKFEHMLHLPQALPLTDVEICSLLGNICSNALEACQKITQDNAPKYIQLIIKPYRESLIIHSENTCNNIFNIKNGNFLTTKKEHTEHGLGLNRINNIVENAGGFMKIETSRNIFKINIVLPLTINDDDCI